MRGASVGVQVGSGAKNTLAWVAIALANLLVVNVVRLVAHLKVYRHRINRG